jgi:RNA polymerase sigma-70 factor, ECF subfamily
MSTKKQEEFLGLLEPVYQRLWRFALATTRDHVNAQDLLSETILAAYERFDTVRDARAFTSFLFTVATRIQRHRERRARWFGAYDEGMAERLHSVTPSPEVAAEIAVLLDALSRLGSKQRETLTLFEISGFTLEEIREIQGGTLSGVKSRLKRAREALARELGVRTDAGEEKDELSTSAEHKPESVDASRLLTLAINE